MKIELDTKAELASNFRRKTPEQLRADLGRGSSNATSKYDTRPKRQRTRKDEKRAAIRDAS